MAQWTELPKYVYQIVADNPESVLLQTSRFDASNQRSYLFLSPRETLTAITLEEIPSVFAKIQQALSENLYAAGFVSYECGYHFERFDGAAVIHQEVPLAWFGLYSNVFIFDHFSGCFAGEAPPHPHPVAKEVLPAQLATNLSLRISEEDYRRKIARIKDLIVAGDTYQVNFTDRVSLPIPYSPAIAFEMLARQQAVSYAAFLHAAGHHVLSLSPELFFKTSEGTITARPMKGTMPRGLDVAEDALARQQLQRDEKNRSEHVMIVDLLRNDLGRICTMGSVVVEDIFSVERYETLFQMTSTVSGRLQAGLTYYDIFRNIFPSGSITGAPKIRTMQIIRELEERPRGIYTGAIGYMAPDDTSTFNVAIRTLVLKDDNAEMGVGGGIVADSTPDEEYRECLLKASFLARPYYDFQLFETLLWDRDFSFLTPHLDRLESSASYFNFAFDPTSIRSQLEDAAKLFSPQTCYRVKLILDASGSVEIRSAPVATAGGFRKVRLSSERTLSQDVFLRHKTTRRELYEQEYAAAVAGGFDDALFINEKGEVTEGAISNLFVRLGGKLLTPPLRCGVLPGIYRAHLLATRDAAEERILTLADLEAADEVLLCNSVRGISQVQLLHPHATLVTAAI